METNILVIGNGFDIYHGLKTKYFDFVEFTRKINSEEDIETNIIDLCNTNTFIRYFQAAAKDNQGWIDCEKEIEMLTDIFHKIFNNTGVLGDDGYINKNVINSYEHNIFSYTSKYIFNEYGRLRINEAYRHRFKSLNKELMIADLNKDLNNLIEVFHYYLSKKICIEDISTRSKQLMGIKFSYVVNFNYTDTFRLYNIDPSNACYIHGSSTSGFNSMILGTRDTESENLDFIYFRKYFQRIQKNADLLDRERFVAEISTYGSSGFYYPQNDSVNSHFFGHSLSNTDGDIIREIVKLSDKLIIYHYDKKDFEQKVINLIDIFGKEKALELINEKIVEFIRLETPEAVD